MAALATAALAAVVLLHIGREIGWLSAVLGIGYGVCLLPVLLRTRSGREAAQDDHAPHHPPGKSLP